MITVCHFGGTRRDGRSAWQRRPGTVCWVGKFFWHSGCMVAWRGGNQAITRHRTLEEEAMLTPTIFRYQSTNGVDRMFDRFFGTLATPSLFDPAADVRETKESYEISLELPGTSAAQVNV